MNTSQNTFSSIPQQPSPTPEVPPTILPQHKEGGNNMFIYLLIGITLFVLIGLVGFIVLSMTMQTNPKTNIEDRVYVTAAPTVPPATPTIESEEEEVESITIDDPGEEIDIIEKDLNSL